jgi:hypothetical protein
MRVKDVTIINKAGASDSTVISKKIWSVTVGVIDFAVFSSPTEKIDVAISGSAAQQLAEMSSIKQT